MTFPIGLLAGLRSTCQNLDLLLCRRVDTLRLVLQVTPASMPAGCGQNLEVSHWPQR